MSAEGSFTAGRPRVLCVDDDPDLLEGLELHLRQSFDVWTAPSGGDGLQILASHGPFDVVASDMRMPTMDGAAFLQRARQMAPETVRIVLTGYANVEAAIAVVNGGQIFRFLTKPCPPAELERAIFAAVEHRRLVGAERELLDKTLRGSVSALVDILTQVSPSVFGRASRIRRYALELADAVDLGAPWELEVAASLCQLGYIVIPSETSHKVMFGQPLTADEQRLVDGVPDAVERLLSHIPRLERVRWVLRQQNAAKRVSETQDPTLIQLAEILRLAVDLDTLETQGISGPVALATLRERAGRYDAGLLDALGRVHGGADRRGGLREMPLAAVKVGMVFAQDVRLKTGVLLVANGYEVTPSFLARATNIRPGTVVEPVKVFASTAPTGPAAR